MKKTLILTMMGFFLVTGFIQANELKAFIAAPTGVWVKFTLNFHRPKTYCQSGFGICLDVSAGIEDAPNARPDQNLCPVRARLNERNQLIAEITEEALASYEKGSTLPYFKDKANITILDPYTLSPATCKALGSSSPLTIKPANYPVSFADGVYTVVFQL